MPQLPPMSQEAKSAYKSIYTSIRKINPRLTPDQVSAATLQQMQRMGYAAVRQPNGTVAIRKITPADIQKVATAVSKARKSAPKQMKQNQPPPRGGMGYSSGLPRSAGY